MSILEAPMWLIFFPFAFAFILGFLYYGLWKLLNPLKN